MTSHNGDSSTDEAASSSSMVGGESAPKRTTVQHQQLPPRPKLVPTYPSAEAPTRPRSATTDGHAEDLPFHLSGLSTLPTSAEDGWTSIITAPAHAPMQSWLVVMESLIRHPERTSSNILRADIVAETQADGGPQDTVGGWRRRWTMRRVLIPRRPNLDWRMEQDCSLWYRTTRSEKAQADHDGDEEEEVEEAVVIYTPLIGDVSHAKMDVSHIDPSSSSSASRGLPPPDEAYVPFYHPKVRALAFHFHPSPSLDEPLFGQLSISLIPFSPPHPYPPTHRLTRVTHSLLTTLHMHTWGHAHDYTKRVHHDTVVPRALYQDIYLSLKVKYAGELIRGWVEATDPKKHVFEEMGIAAFLLGLWRMRYGGEERGRVKFVDVGCGNGLLTYILSREGFTGVGLDLRARKSWPNFTSAVLREWNFNPASLLTEVKNDEWSGAWLLGNHADQLTPWIPLLATHHNAAGFINLPCCYYGLDGTRNFELTLKGVGVSRNEQYLAYVGALHARAGWKVELDPLRIPSTKNWCFVGRERDNGVEKEVLEKRVREAVEEALRSGWATVDSST